MMITPPIGNRYLELCGLLLQKLSRKEALDHPHILEQIEALVQHAEQQQFPLTSIWIMRFVLQRLLATKASAHAPTTVASREEDWLPQITEGLEPTQGALFGVLDKLLEQPQWQAELIEFTYTSILLVLGSPNHPKALELLQRARDLQPPPRLESPKAPPPSKHTARFSTGIATLGLVTFLWGAAQWTWIHHQIQHQLQVALARLS